MCDFKIWNVDYFCTWDTQAVFADKANAVMDEVAIAGQQGTACSTRDAINEQAVFGDNGWIDYYPEVRKHLYFLIDDGWDVDYGVQMKEGDWEKFGSHNLNETRFPSFKGSPEEKLKEFVRRVKEKGWKGLGIWIPAQQYGADFRKGVTQTRDFWVEMLLRSKNAGVSYWKVDWGTWAYDANIRRQFSELAREIYPELVIEHGICCWLIADKDNYIGRFENDASCARAVALTQFSDVVRSYDVSPQLSMATTLDRIYNVLPNSNAIINCEDEHYMAASLGFAMGVMSMPETAGGLRAAAVTRWHQVAPAFVGGSCEFSQKVYLDWYDFEPGDTWARFLDGRRVYQGAPAIFARNTTLPKVDCDGEPPFVAASMNPNGAYSVASLKRTLGKTTSSAPIVECEINAAPENIGLFGAFKKVTLNLTKAPRAIALRNLITDETSNITTEGELSSYLVICEEILDKYHKTCFGEEAAYHLKIVY